MMIKVKDKNNLQNINSYKDQIVKDELEKQFNKKCCYCETSNIKGQVEHFRPKSKYNWLRDKKENLLWSCGDCNQLKGAKLPVAEKKAIEPDSCFVCDKKEQLIMINPIKTNPEKFIQFTQEGKIFSENILMEKTIEICKLDRNNLNDKRKEVFDDLKMNINSMKRFSKDRDLKNHVKETFITPITKNKELSFIAFRKYIVRNWLADLLP